MSNVDDVSFNPLNCYYNMYAIWDEDASIKKLLFSNIFDLIHMLY